MRAFARRPGSKARPAVYAGDAPWKGPEGDTNLRAVFRADALFGLLLGVLVMGALRGVLVVVAQLFQLLVEGLDGGFLLAENLFDQGMRWEERRGGKECRSRWS